MSNDESQGKAGDFVKRILSVGVGTLFLTEESLKGMIGEFKLPKEIVGSILDGAKNVRKEFMQNVVSEMMSKVQDKFDPSVMMADFLKKNEITLEVKIKVKEKQDQDADSSLV